MRPVKAIALSVSKKLGTKIKLESGTLVTLPYNKNINAGQTLLIKYNFTKNSVSGVINPYHIVNLTEPAKLIYGILNNQHENSEKAELELSQQLDDLLA